jgi:hypothetical protein
MKFKVGDKITPVEDSGNWLREGDIHIVRRTYTYDGDNYVELDIGGENRSWYEWRFKLANMHIIDGR